MKFTKCQTIFAKLLKSGSIGRDVRTEIAIIIITIIIVYKMLILRPLMLKLLISLIKSIWNYKSGRYLLSYPRNSRGKCRLKWKWNPSQKMKIRSNTLRFIMYLKRDNAVKWELAVTGCSTSKKNYLPSKKDSILSQDLCRAGIRKI